MTVTLGPRYSYIEFMNEGTSIVYVRTDGQDAADSGNQDGTTAVIPGGHVLLANGLPLWSQAALDIPYGREPGESLYGQTADPGTSVSVVSSAASVPFTIEGSG
jgi:hypothetical protein